MNTMVMRYLMVALAGSVGAVARYALGMWFGRSNTTFPIGTFIINVTGCFILGWFLTYAERHNVSPTTRLAIGVGFVGAYTTFSTFMYETNRLMNDKAWYEAFAYLSLSLIVGLLAVRLGIVLARGN
jgi:CrcB protein